MTRSPRPTKDQDAGVPASPSGSRPTDGAASVSTADAASIPNAVSALNVTDGLFLDEGGRVYPVTNWFDEDGDECPRADATTCVAGEGGCWFALTIADFCETAAQA